MCSAKTMLCRNHDTLWKVKCYSRFASSQIKIRALVIWPQSSNCSLFLSMQKSEVWSGCHWFFLNISFQRHNFKQTSTFANLVRNVIARPFQWLVARQLKEKCPIRRSKSENELHIQRKLCFRERIINISDVLNDTQLSFLVYSKPILEPDYIPPIPIFYDLRALKYLRLTFTGQE